MGHCDDDEKSEPKPKLVEPPDLVTDASHLNSVLIPSEMLVKLSVIALY